MSFTKEKKKSLGGLSASGVSSYHGDSGHMLVILAKGGEHICTLREREPESWGK